MPRRASPSPPRHRLEFLSWPRICGLRGVRIIVGDKAAGVVGSIAEVLPDAVHQRCAVRFYRNVLAKVSKAKGAAFFAMSRANHAMGSREAKALEFASELKYMRFGEAAKVVSSGFAETLAYTRFPPEHRRKIRTNNARAAQQGDRA